MTSTVSAIADRPDRHAAKQQGSLQVALSGLNSIRQTLSSPSFHRSPRLTKIWIGLAILPFVIKSEDAASDINSAFVR